MGFERGADAEINSIGQADARCQGRGGFDELRRQIDTAYPAPEGRDQIA
jgi:hypothetical protein